MSKIETNKLFIRLICELLHPYIRTVNRGGLREQLINGNVATYKPFSQADVLIWFDEMHAERRFNLNINNFLTKKCNYEGRRM